MKISIFLLCLALVGASANGQTEENSGFTTITNTLTLLPEVQIPGESVLLSDLVPPSQKTTVPTIRLGPAPGIGRVALITRAQINGLIQKVAPSCELPVWEGSQTIRLTCKVKVVTEEILRKLLTERLQDDFVRERGELDLRLAQPWPSLTVPDQKLDIKILDVPAAGIVSAFSVRFELLAGTQIIGQYALSVQARIWHDVQVARGAITRGTLLGDSSVGAERRDVLSVRDPMLELPLDRDLEFNDTVPSGAPLSYRMFRQRPVVQRGAVLYALIRQGTLTISVKVEALEDGLLGSNIRVRNTESKREFRGKVVDEATISVSI